jgi:hypothetical protein
MLRTKLSHVEGLGERVGHVKVEYPRNSHQELGAGQGTLQPLQWMTGVRIGA